MRKAILRANSVSCLSFGAFFVFAPTAVQSFMGDPPVWLVLTIGVTLILNGAHLVWASLRRTPPFELRYFAAGDFFWVLTTALMIASGVWIKTALGITVAVAVAFLVGSFGILQWRMAGKPKSFGAAS